MTSRNEEYILGEPIKIHRYTGYTTLVKCPKCKTYLQGTHRSKYLTCENCGYKKEK